MERRKKIAHDNFSWNITKTERVNTLMHNILCQ